MPRVLYTAYTNLDWYAHYVRRFNRYGFQDLADLAMFHLFCALSAEEEGAQDV